MSIPVAIVCWYLTVLVAGVIGYRGLQLIGLGPVEAWSGGRILGLSLVILLPWWLGWIGVSGWLVTAEIVFILAALFAVFDTLRRRALPLSVMVPETVFLVAFIAILLVRLDHPEILHTEKFMDMGVLTSLLRTPGFPPPDFWLGGETLPYYYWGALLWVVPLSILEIEAAVGYNLIVATIGGLIAVLAWSIGRFLCRGSAGGLITALLCVAAGTADGFRQLAATHDLYAVDIWQSSRQASHVITEFPLFTLWLGDLHPHLLSMPLCLIVILLGVFAAQQEVKLFYLSVMAVVLGTVAAANPWAYPPTVVTASLLLLCGRKVRWPGTGRALKVVAIPLYLISVSCLAALPFLGSYSAPFQGFGWVWEGTAAPSLVLYAGVLLVPVFGYVLSRIQKPWDDPLTGQVVTLSGTALVALVAAVSGRPTLVITGALLLALIYMCAREPAGPARSATILAAMGVFLLLVPELVYVRDNYDIGLFRLNTVFKSYIQAWLLLSLAAPLLLLKWLPRALPRRSLIAAIVLVAAIHPAALVARFSPGVTGLDGLAWMDAGDRAIVDYLSKQPDGLMVLEATGDPYGEHARISSNSGVPAYLGWKNHQLVWRGGAINAELERRATMVESVYSETDPDRITTLLQREGVSHVVIGSLERRNYPAPALEAIARAGRVVFEQGDSIVVQIQ